MATNSAIPVARKASVSTWIMIRERPAPMIFFSAISLPRQAAVDGNRQVDEIAAYGNKLKMESATMM